MQVDRVKVYALESELRKLNEKIETSKGAQNLGMYFQLNIYLEI
jgi:hypothetical protein